MSQFIEMFGTVENNTHNFPIMTIGEFANCFAGATPSTSHPEYWENGRIRWMSSGEVHKGHVEDTDSRITELGYKSASTRMVPIHSIVIAIAGQGKTRGTVAITEVDLCTNQSLCAIVPDERVNYSYLYHNLQGRYLELRGLSGDVNGRGGLNLKIIQKIPVILPPIEKQQQFASIAQQADKSKFGDFKSQFIEMFGNPLSSKQKNELKRLGQCCIINPRRPNIALCDTDKVSFIPMPAVSEDGYLVDMADEEYGKVKKGFTYFENNDVLFAKITPCMENGKGAIAYGLTNGIGVGSTEFHVLRPINGISSPYWLLALTRMPIFRERAAKNMSGTGGQKRVSASYLNHFMVGLPAIEEQRRFEAIYRQADKSKFGDFKSQFIEMYYNTHNKQTLESVCPIMNKGITPKYVESSSVLVINQACIHWDGQRLGNIKYHNEEIPVRKRILESGDVLLNATGNGTLGRCCVFICPSDNNTYINDGHVIALSTDRAVILPEVLNTYLSLNDTQAEIYRQYVTGSTNQVDIVFSDIKKMKVPVPSMDEQILFVEVLTQADKSKSVIQKALVYLNDIQSDELRKIA